VRVRLHNAAKSAHRKTHCKFKRPIAGSVIGNDHLDTLTTFLVEKVKRNGDTAQAAAQVADGLVGGDDDGK
jgi:hypothetical protein